MKPPPRARKTPQRIGQLAEAPRRARRAACHWRRAEQHRLLRALKALQPTAGPPQDLDYSLLEARLPSRPPSEVRSVVEQLKRQVISCAAQQLRKATRAERSAARPIDQWTQLAAAVTGSHEDAIAAAFSQVLVAASVEPCTLRNSQPPVDPAGRPPPTGRAPPTAGRPPPTGKPQSPLAGNPPEARRPRPPAAPRPLTTPPDSSPPDDAAPPSTSSSSSGGVWGKDMVDFERIYCFFSRILKPTDFHLLTPMESAVVLDLLMSLPEELRLLDCNKLRRHLIQVFRRCSAPRPSQTHAAGEGLQVRGRDPGGPREAGGESEEGPDVPPLNPLAVPLRLLRRREDQVKG